LLLDFIVNFLAIYRHAVRNIDTELDPLSLGRENGNFDMVSQVKALPRTSGQNEHVVGG
jgi:hypothetical protein